MDNPNAISPSVHDIDAMRKVLESFNNVGSSVLHEVSNNSDTEINNLMQSALSGNVKIGNVFEIRIREMESLRGTKKVYDIYNCATNECISDDLFLYEAAYVMVKYLNKGHNLLSSEIRKIAKLEQDYASLRTDAGVFRVRLNENLKRNDKQRASLFETRFQDAKDKALAVKAEIIKIAESL